MPETQSEWLIAWSGVAKTEKTKVLEKYADNTSVVERETT